RAPAHVETLPGAIARIAEPVLVAPCVKGTYGKSDTWHFAQAAAHSAKGPASGASEPREES
ncbi:MAG TPA: hypothetical protein VGS41_12080, partial [Chthonomonadales bacterium]|nr:hypothetical protein [Chthonomonadales bacterium]